MTGSVFCKAPAGLLLPELWDKVPFVHPKEYDIEWRKSRLAARLLIQKSKRALSPRRQVLAVNLSQDKAVSNRLINQALAGFYARRPHTVPLD